MRTNRLVWLAAIVVAFALASPGAAADNSAVVGKWSMELNIQGQTRQIDLEFMEKDGELAGTVTGPQGGTNDLSDVSWDGETLAFKRDINRQGQEFSISYSAKVEDDEMNGTMTTPRGERPFTAKRGE